ncbi:tetratricopeptide repeat protein 4 [Spea bombifrons]|uniref:tetratricopeptide repeat protein 4 n=1 Tax=Spea bombifrons TaxID=233779 RepID=UPI00234ABAC6|nr:tetratricopeptide repeat protein 4 [Spea bombifrons]XP_053325216.1 tetratricopeptide repeat protein 4 [Spea bombifrons]
MDSQGEDDDTMDQFMEKFKTQKYEGAFNEDNWEEEFDKIPMFMKKAPQEIDPEKAPELACLQSILFDEDRPLEEQAESFKDEGNEYFKEKNYEKAVASYTEGIKKKCKDVELNAILYTNRAAAQFYLGNYRSALNDAIAARKQKPDHLKAVIRGALCCVEIKNYREALKWCEEGLKINPTEKKLIETRTKADRLQRAAERDARKSKLAEKKKQSKKDSLLNALKDRGIKLHQQAAGEDEEETSEFSYDGISSENATGSQVFLDESGRLHWPVLFLYPEHMQTDFISAFPEDSRFIDHLNAMFNEDYPPWDTDRKYFAPNLEVYFEDEETQSFYQVNPERTLLEAMQHRRFRVKAGSPSFLIFVKQSSFYKKYFTDRKVYKLT